MSDLEERIDEVLEKYHDYTLYGAKAKKQLLSLIEEEKREARIDERRLRESLRDYRIRADMAHSEVEDGVHTVEEYHKALGRIEDLIIQELRGNDE